MTENLSKLSQYLEMGKIAVESNDQEGLLKFSTEILEMEPKNSYGWFFKAQYFLSKATNGNMQSEGYISSMKKAFEYADEFEKKIFINKVIDNIQGYIFGIISQKQSMGFTAGSTLDSVYIGSFNQLVNIKISLDEFIIINDLEIENKLEQLFRSYGEFRKKFPLNQVVNSLEVQKVFEKGISPDKIQQIRSENELARTSNAVGYVILVIIGIIALVWFLGWGIVW